MAPNASAALPSSVLTSRAEIPTPPPAPRLCIGRTRSWYMGCDALLANGITRKLAHLARDRALAPPGEPLARVRASRVALFVGVQLVGFGAAMAITQTIGACLSPSI